MRLIFSNLMKKCEKSTDEEIIEHGRGRENVWNSVHELNQSSKYFEQNFDKKDIAQIEELCGKEWTNEWIKRTKNKNEPQKSKDRELLEQIGSWEEINGKRSNPNETEIERLLANGATIDFFVHSKNEEYGYLWNAIEFAFYARKEEILKLLIKRFPNYMNEPNRDWNSLLGRLFTKKMFSAGIELIKTKEPVHPLYDILWYLKVDSKFKNLIEEIFKVYNPSTQVKLDFQMLSDKNRFQDKDVERNLELLKKYFLNDTHYGPKFIQLALGSTYEINDPICSRFERNGKKFWVAQEIQNLGLEELVEFKSDAAGKIQVNLYNILFTNITVKFLDFRKFQSKSKCNFGKRFRKFFGGNFIQANTIFSRYEKSPRHRRRIDRFQKNN